MACRHLRKIEIEGTEAKREIETVDLGLVRCIAEREGSPIKFRSLVHSALESLSASFGASPNGEAL